MIILTLRTDKPEAELGIYDDTNQLQYVTWQAHRELAETIHLKLAEVLAATMSNLHKLDGIVVFQGPGSFTGLRIGISVANALADALKIPIVGREGDDWLEVGLNAIQGGENHTVVLPEYGALPNVSTPKK